MLVRAATVGMNTSKNSSPKQQPGPHCAEGGGGGGGDGGGDGRSHSGYSPSGYATCGAGGGWIFFLSSSLTPKLNGMLCRRSMIRVDGSSSSRCSLSSHGDVQSGLSSPAVLFASVDCGSWPCSTLSPGAPPPSPASGLSPS